MKKKILLITLAFVMLSAVLVFANVVRLDYEIKETKIPYTISNFAPGGVELISATGDGLINLCSAEDKDGKYGYIDTNGQVVIPFIYDFAKPFSEGLAIVRKDNKCGYIDTEGKIVIPIIYDYAYEFSEGLAEVEKDGKCGYINKNGEVVIPFIYDRTEPFSEGLAAVEKDNKLGYINKNGEVVIPFIYDRAEFFSEGLATVKKDNKWGYIDTEGKVVISFLYEYAQPFFDGVAEVTKNNKTIYINAKGEEVEYVGLSLYRDGDKFGYKNEKGEIVIQPIYDYIDWYIDGEGNGSYDFYNGVAFVTRIISVDNEGFTDYEMGLIDKEGNMIIDFGEYKYIDHAYGLNGPSEEYLIVYKIDENWEEGLIDYQGKVVIPCEYSKIIYLGEDTFLAEKIINEDSYERETYIIKLGQPEIMDYPIHGDSDYPSIVEFTNKTFSWKNVCVIALICIIVIFTVIVIVVKNKSKKANNKNNKKDDIENKEE